MIKQSPFTLIATVSAHRCDELCKLLSDEMSADAGRNAFLPFGRLNGVHFGRVMLIEASGHAFAPLLSMETNYDGTWENHLANLIEVAEQGLARLFSYCEDFTGDVAAFIQAHKQTPAAFYQGHRWRSLQQILQEDQLHQEIRSFLNANTYRLAQLNQREIRLEIRKHIDSQPHLGWAHKEKGLSSFAQWWLQHWELLLVYAGLAFVCTVVGSLFDWTGKEFWAFALVWGISLIGILFGMLATGIPLKIRLGVVCFGIVPALGVLMGVCCPLLGAIVVAASIASVLWLLNSWWNWRLNQKERSDDPKPPKATSKDVADLLTHENQFVQNQLTHLVKLKKRGFRQRSLKVVLTLINWSARILYNKGNLGGITSIHFARWVFIDNDRGLLFNSNYDGSWESYLGDFTDKAAEGLTAVWSHTEGFPTAKNLIKQGARDERNFKEWARAHQIITHVWYSAYPTLSVSDINNNSRIQAGLFRPLFTKSALARWFRRL